MVLFRGSDGDRPVFPLIRQANGTFFYLAGQTIFLLWRLLEVLGDAFANSACDFRVIVVARLFALTMIVADVGK